MRGAPVAEVAAVVHCGMRAQSRLYVDIDLITSTAMAAELAKASGKFHATLLLEPAQDEPDTSPGLRAVLRRDEPDWLSQDLKKLVYLRALCEDISPNRVMEELRRDLERWLPTLNRSPADVQGIGDLASGQ